MPSYWLSRAWKGRGPEVVVHRITTNDVPRDSDLPLPDVVHDRLNATFDMKRGEVLRVDVVRYDRLLTSDVIITWAHPLFDATGSEMFVRRLGECFSGRRDIGTIDTSDDEGCDQTSFAERLSRARAWRAQMVRIGRNPPRSLAGPRRRVRQALECEVITLSHDETEATMCRAASFAGHLTPVAFYVAVAIRAHDAVFAHRQQPRPASYLVPLPVNIRPKGREGPLFRTNASLIWFHVGREYVGELSELVAEVARQRRESIRNGEVENALTAMNVMRYAPSRLLSWMARSNLRGEFASFYFAFTGEFLPDVREFCGAPILNGFHAPAVMPSPGSCLAFSIFNGRMNIVHVRQSDVITPAERVVFRRRLLADLTGSNSN